MLPKKNRLNLSKQESRRAFRGKKFVSKEFVILYRKSSQSPKAAITVSKKVAPKAVDRNRIRRIISQYLKDEKLFGGELIIIVKENIAKLKTQEVKEKLRLLLETI